MGHQHESAPRSAKTAEKDPAPIEEEATSHPRPVALDSARAASLLLRQVLAAGERAYSGGGIGQAIAFARRLEDVLDEVGALEKLQPASADALAEDLGTVRTTMTKIASRLGNDEKLSTFAADVLAKLDALKPAGGGSSAPKPAPKDLSVPERMELARLELAAVRTQVATVLASQPKNADEAARVCAPLKGHLDEARQAALGIERFTREPLFADVDQISHELDGVERALTMDPKFAWNAAFANTFDAENRLRSTVGLPARLRSYSGKVDPVAAAQKVRQALDDAAAGKDASVDTTPDTPEASVVHVGLSIASAYERMHDQMTQFKDDFSVEDAKLSLGDILLNVAVGAVLDAATAGVAAFMGNALGKVLGSSAKAVEHETEHVVVEGLVIPHSVEHAEIRNSSLNDSIKGRVTGLMKAATSKAQVSPVKLASPTLLNQFVANTIARIADAKLNSVMLAGDLGQALAQLDPTVLAELATEIRTKINEPALAVRARALIEYEKLRTENAVASRDRADPLLDGKHLGLLRDDDMPGVLEVGLRVSTTNQMTFDHLRLQGGEPAARLRLREQKRSIRDLGLHRIFNVRFDAATAAPGLAAILRGRDYLTFGVGASGGLQLATISEQEWLWLRLFAADRPVDDLQALALAFHDRDAQARSPSPAEAAAHLRHEIEQRRSQDAAVAKVRSLIAFGDTLDTDKVEP